MYITSSDRRLLSPSRILELPVLHKPIMNQLGSQAFLFLNFILGRAPLVLEMLIQGQLIYVFRPPFSPACQEDLLGIFGEIVSRESAEDGLCTCQLCKMPMALSDIRIMRQNIPSGTLFASGWFTGKVMVVPLGRPVPGIRPGETATTWHLPWS